MNIKTATKIGLAGTCLMILLGVSNILIDFEVIQYDKNFNLFWNLIYLSSSLCLATFFFVLHKNQK